jgi:EmrB/QacA subfamily drug resistance transporter
MNNTHRPLTVVAILLSMFRAAMEATVVATAMPTVIAELHGLELYGWVGAVYMLATTVTIPLWGKASDLWGRRPTMLAGLAVFLFGSMACGVSTTMAALIVFRGVQGVGAGALQPIALTIVGDLFTLEERAKIQGVFGAVWGFAGIAGPLLGGFIVRSWSWRWIFYINAPIAVLSAVLLILFFRERDGGTPQPSLDLAGAFVLTLAILALLAGFAGYAAAWTLPLALALTAVFLWIERRAAEPILPFSLFAVRPLVSASVCSVLMGAVMMGILMYTPLYIQAVRQATPTEAGASIAPMLVGWPLASALGGRLLPRIGYRLLVRGGLVLVAIASVGVYEVLRHDAGLLPLQLAMFFFGAGMGFANTAILIAVQQSVSFRQRGIATASTMFFRTIGGTLAVGALGVLVAHAVSDEVSSQVLSELLGPTHGAALDPAVVQSATRAMIRGMQPVFLTLAALGVLVGAVSFAFPELPTRAPDALAPPATE